MAAVLGAELESVSPIGKTKDLADRYVASGPHDDNRSPARAYREVRAKRADLFVSFSDTILFGHRDLVRPLRVDMPILQSASMGHLTAPLPRFQIRRAIGKYSSVASPDKGSIDSFVLFLFTSISKG